MDIDNKILEMFREKGMMIELGDNFSAKGQIAQLLNVVKPLLLEIDELRAYKEAAERQYPVLITASEDFYHDLSDIPANTKLYARPIPPQQAAAPHGWKLVPIEPTKMMEEAMEFEAAGFDFADQYWQNILAAVIDQPELDVQSHSQQSADTDSLRAFADEVKQLCSDFSDLQNRPYMGDVTSAIDGLYEQFNRCPSHESEQSASPAPAYSQSAGIERAYREGWETGWAERHSSLNNDARVNPWIIPAGAIDSDWDISDAKKCELPASDSEQGGEA